MKPVLRTHALFVSLALVIATNAVALGGIAYNRLGEPESVLALTERELTVPGSYGFESENSGLSLHLNWRVSLAPHLYGHDPEWLNGEKLKALGFDLPPANGPDSQRSPLRRHAYLVLELGGKSYEAMLTQFREKAKAEAELAATNPDRPEFVTRSRNAQEALEREEREGSRLFVIDAGSNVEALRTRYPDRARYAIVHGTVQPFLRTKDRQWYGFVTVLPSYIHVPLAYRQAFAEAERTRTRGPDRARFTADVGFGRRLEPWIAAAKPVAKQAPGG